MPGRFKVWRPDEDERDDAREFTAHDAKDAVTKWAAWDDAYSVEYRIVSGAPASVLVQNVMTGEQSTWSVSGETVAHYSARRTEGVPDAE